MTKVVEHIYNTSNNHLPSFMINITELYVVKLNGKRVDLERLPARIDNF